MRPLVTWHLQMGGREMGAAAQLLSPVRGMVPLAFRVGLPPGIDST